MTPRRSISSDVSRNQVSSRDKKNGTSTCTSLQKFTIHLRDTIRSKKFTVNEPSKRAIQVTHVSLNCNHPFTTHVLQFTALGRAHSKCRRVNYIRCFSLFLCEENCFDTSQNFSVNNKLPCLLLEFGWYEHTI